MPRARRNKVVSLTKTAKKTRADKESMLDKVREAAEQYSFVWLFSIGNMRNACLKEVRQLWEGSRLFYGKLGVLRKALGTAEEDEIRTGISNISNRLAGPVGLLFTDSLPKEVQDWFASYSRKDFARAGNVATETVELPEGPIMIQSNPPETMPHSIEPQLRQLGMPTELKRGIPTLLRDYTVCKKGKKISKEGAQILKHLLIMQAEFRIIPLAYWSAVEAEKGAKQAVKEIKLTKDQAKLIEQSQALGSSTVGKLTKPKNKDKARAKKAATNGEAADVDAEDSEEDEEMGDDDEDDDDDEEGDDEDVEFAAGDKVTEGMMLPAHLR